MKAIEGLKHRIHEYVSRRTSTNTIDRLANELAYKLRERFEESDPIGSTDGGRQIFGIEPDYEHLGLLVKMKYAKEYMIFYLIGHRFGHNLTPLAHRKYLGLRNQGFFDQEPKFA